MAFLAVNSYAYAKTYPRENYPFPLKNPLLATIASAATVVDDHFERHYIDMRPDRAHVPIIGERHKVLIGLFPQKGPAPLTFVISGTGGSALTNSSLLLASKLKAKGYHVVTLPNSMNWQYVLGVSETATPGYLPDDAKEYYSFLRKVAAYLREERGLLIQSYSLVGYSYGGLISGFLAREDEEQRKFDFRRVVILNPAIDVGYAVSLLDSFYFEGLKTSEIRRDIIMASIMDVGMKIFQKGFDTNMINREVAKLGLGLPDLQWVIAYNFRQNLGDLIFASQQVHDLGLLKRHADESHLSARLAESNTFSFATYMEDFVAPNLKFRDKYKMHDLLQLASLTDLGELIRRNERIYIMENEDDILARPEDIEFLKSVAGDRLYLYPFGGHCGNYWFPQNGLDLQEIMAL